MYIQITTRCNMHCAHCMFSCTSEGEDMSLDVYKRALEWATNLTAHVTIGGGEPTIHPLFEVMIGMATKLPVKGGIVTNGKLREKALLLLKMARADLINCSLSQDEYHEPIDKDVIEQFSHELFGFNSGHNPIAVGRATRLMESHPQTWCLSQDPFVMPDGSIRQCACPDGKIIGNIKEGFPNYVPGCGRPDAEKGPIRFVYT